MENRAQWSFHALRARPGMDSAHLSCRAIRRLLDQGPPWRQWSQPQPVNQAQDLSEQGSWYGDLRHLERDVATVLYHPGADLDQFLAHRRERSMLDLQRQRQCLLWVRNGPSAAPPGRSAPEGEADESGAKPDIETPRSVVGGRADVVATWPGSPLLATRRHSPASKSSHLKGWNRPKSAIEARRRERRFPDRRAVIARVELS